MRRIRSGRSPFLEAVKQKQSSVAGGSEELQGEARNWRGGGLV